MTTELKYRLAENIYKFFENFNKIFSIKSLQILEKYKTKLFKNIPKWKPILKILHCCLSCKSYITLVARSVFEFTHSVFSKLYYLIVNICTAGAKGFHWELVGIVQNLLHKFPRGGILFLI